MADDQQAAAKEEAAKEKPAAAQPAAAHGGAQVQSELSASPAADSAARASVPLPGRAMEGGWREYQTAEGRKYYHHAATSTTQWAPPQLGQPPAASAPAAAAAGQISASGATGAQTQQAAAHTLQQPQAASAAAVIASRPPTAAVAGRGQVPAFSQAAAHHAAAHVLHAAAAISAAGRGQMIYQPLTPQQVQQLTPLQQQHYQMQQQQHLQQLQQAHRAHLANHAALTAATARMQPGAAGNSVQQQLHIGAAEMPRVGAAAALVPGSGPPYAQSAAVMGGIGMGGKGLEHVSVPKTSEGASSDLSAPGDGALRDALAAAALKASLAARAQKQSQPEAQGGAASGGAGEKSVKEARAPALLQPSAETMETFMQLDCKFPSEAAAVEGLAPLASLRGLPVYAVQNVGKQDPQQTTVASGSEVEKAEETAPTTPKTTFGKLIYKGQGCNFSVACITAEGKAEKLGPMQFVKVAGNNSSRPRNVMFLCCNGQSVAEFEKAHAIPVDPALLESKREKQGKKDGDGVLTEVDTRPKAGPNATKEWPINDLHACEEDERCCDVAKLYDIDLELLVEKNKFRYKSLNKVIRLKAGTTLILPLPGETKELYMQQDAVEKERARQESKKRKLEEGGGGSDKKQKMDKKGKDAKSRPSGRSKGGESAAVAAAAAGVLAALDDTPEEPVEEVMARASDDDTAEVCGARQIAITDRLPYNVTLPDTEPHLWDQYRDSTLLAKSFQEVGVQLKFMESQIIPAALHPAWEKEERAAFGDKCSTASDAKAINACMNELFLRAINWAAVDAHWDLIEEEEAAIAAGGDDDVEAPAALVKKLSQPNDGLQVYVEGAKTKSYGKLYIGRHPKTGAPIWLVEPEDGSKGGVKASVFAGAANSANTNHFLRRIFMTPPPGSPSKREKENRQCLLDWLVAEGHADPLELSDMGGGLAMATVPSHIETKLAQAMTRTLQLIDRIPFAAVKSKKQELWVACSHRIVEAAEPRVLAMELKWFIEQLLAKILQAPWVANGKGAWEVSCDRVVALKDYYMVLMELEDEAINWRAVDSRWAIERAPRDEASGESRSHKKRQKTGPRPEGPCPLPVPVPHAIGKLPEGWKVEVKSATVWRPEECYVMFRTPDGYYLQSIDDVLKYYQKHKMLQSFSESTRKGFVAAQQEAKATHAKHMHRLAKWLLPMPDYAVYLNDPREVEGADTSIGRESKMMERAARQAEAGKAANSPRSAGGTPASKEPGAGASAAPSSSSASPHQLAVTVASGALTSSPKLIAGATDSSNSPHVAADAAGPAPAPGGREVSVKGEGLIAGETTTQVVANSSTHPVAAEPTPSVKPAQPALPAAAPGMVTLSDVVGAGTAPTVASEATLCPNPVLSVSAGGATEVEGEKEASQTEVMEQDREKGEEKRAVEEGAEKMEEEDTIL